MKIYLAGTSVSDPKQELKLQSLFQEGYKLHSYYHCVTGFEKKWFKMNRKNQVNLFLDSGAFSAWSQKKDINIQKYISFIKENKKVIDVYANLDVIGSAKKTYQNQMIMEDAGLMPLPTFHYGEKEKWLLKYLDKGYDYIALGGMVPIMTKGLVMWLDRLFGEYLTDEKGMPIYKVHGFGLTSLKLMLRYPWYSVDSTSWVITGRMGSIYIPRRKNGDWTYDVDSWKIVVSTRSPASKEAGRHINTMSKGEREILIEYITEKGYRLGKSSFTKAKQSHKLKENERWVSAKPKDKTIKRELEIIEEEGLSNKYQLRDELNIIYFIDLEKRMPKWPWAYKKNRLKGLI